MIPRQTTMIDADAFYSSNNVTIRGISGSYAEEYAAAHSIPFESIDIPAAQIAITPENPTVNRGRTVQLVLTVTPEDFTDEVQWKTADTDIVTVDERGVVTGIAAGTATVRVTVGNLTKDITVTVNEPISRIYLNQTSAELKAGEVLTLTTTVYPENATNKNMLWTSSNPAVAQVDENGRVLAISKGTATIQAEAADGSGCTASCTVTVTGNLNMVTSVEHFESSHSYQNNLSEVWLYQSPGAERITLTFSDDTEFEAPYDYLEIYANQNQLVGKYTGKELAGQKIVVSGESVLVRLVTDKGGSAYGFRVVDITAEKGDEKPDSALTAIRLNRSSLQLKTDETSKLEVIYEPADTNEDKSVVWDSSNTDIVTVDNTGFITAVSIGTADITVTSVLKPELKDSCTITVSDDDIAEETCTVTFETSGGSSVEPVICRKGSRLSDFGIAVPTKENHIFDGWYKDSECTILWDMNTDTVTSDMTLYAKWTEQNDNNNDNDNMDDDDSAYEMAQRIKLNSVGGQIAAVKSKVYDGSVYRPNIKVTVKENGRTIILTEGADYRVLYDDRINVGAGTITVKGNGKYTGVLTTQYQITPKSLKKLKIVTGGIAADADREIQLEKLPVYVSDAETDSALIYGQDYVLEVIRGNITRKGKLEVNIKAKEGSNYDNIKSVKVKITVYDASGKNFKGIINPENVCYVNEKDKSQIYTGNAIKPEFSVKVGESTLVKNKDFSVKYMNNKEAGVAYAVITGKKGYVGSVVKEFEITPAKSILRLKREIKAVTYNGKLQKPKVSVMAGSKTLKAGRDYTVSYSKNLHASKVRNE